MALEYIYIYDLFGYKPYILKAAVSKRNASYPSRIALITATWKATGVTGRVNQLKYM